MKYLVSLVIGMLLGATLFAAGMYFNPFAERQTVSPLAMSDDEHLDLAYTAVPGETILYTDNGESIISTHPDRVAELWEPAIVDTRIAVNLLTDSRGEAMGLGIKFSTDSEQTRLISSQALVNSVWHIYLPGQGTLLVYQVENYWSYLREVVVPARWSSGDNWRGSWLSNITAGPGALGTAWVAGGSGQFLDLNSEAVEALSAKAYSVEQGPVAMTGELSVEIPRSE